MRKKIILPIIMTFLILPFLALFFFMFSTSGLTTIINLADKLLPGQFKVESAHGRLADHFSLTGLAYTLPDTEVHIENLDISWTPAMLLHKRLTIGAININGVRVHVKQSPPTEDDSVPVGQTLPFNLPLLISIGSADLQSASILLAGHESPYRIDTFSLKDISANGDIIQIGQSKLTDSTSMIEIAGRLQTAEELSLQLEIVYSLSFPGYSVIAGSGKVSGTPETLNVKTELRKPFHGNLQGLLIDLTGKPSWQATLKADHAYLPDISDDWPQFYFSGFKAAGKGSVDTYTVNVNTSSDYKGFKNIHLLTLLSGDANGLHFTDTQLQKQEGRLVGKGQLLWENDFTWQAETTGANINLRNINQDLPDVFVSEITLNGRGINDSYKMMVMADAGYETVEDIHSTGIIEGNGDGLQLKNVELRHAASRLKGNMQLEWTDLLSWKSEWNGEDINPALLYPDWQGVLNGELRADGKWSDETLNGKFTLASLNGTLRDIPLEAQGEVNITGNSIALEDIFVKTTGTEIEASGQIGEKMNLDFRFESFDLSELWPEWRGALRAEGSINGTREEPSIDFDLSGNDLTLYDNTIEELDGKVDANLTPTGSVNAEIESSRLTVAGKNIQTLSIKLLGNAAKHHIQIQADGDDGNFSTEISGGLTEKTWNAVINKTQLETERFGNWNLDQSGNLALSEDNQEIKNFCLVGPGDAQLCLNGNQEKDSGWHTDLMLQSLKLSTLFNFLGKDNNLQLEGEMSTTLNLTGSGKEISNGEFSLQTEDISALIQLPENMDKKLAWQENDIHGRFENKTLMLDITSLLQEGSSFSASLTADNIDPSSFQPEQIKLGGKIDFKILELTPLRILLYSLVDPSGSLNGSFTLDGTIAQPTFTGQAKLEDGKMIIPKLGITLEDFRLVLEGDEKLLKTKVSCSSGKGSLQAEGVAAIKMNQPDTLELSIEGDKFQAVHLPELTLFVSPQFDIQLSHQEGKIQGKVRLNEGLIAPSSLEDSITPSQDVVFVSETGEPTEKWPFSAELEVIFDNQVKIDAFGLRGQLQGQIQVVDLPGRNVTGTGNLEVTNGTFSVYGRELEIKTGRLLFSGGPIENPGVSVRAENKFQDIITGISVSGFLQKPEISFYSDPPMEEQEIISRLLLNTSLVRSSDKNSGFIDSVASGTPLDPITSGISGIKNALRVDDIRMEAGETSEDVSLVIGTWMTPRLYISYGKNLLKESGSFNTKYLLGHGFSMETETGSTESGADLKYEIDK